MSLIEALALGFIQGLTEFLPVSSSGHLVIAQHLFGLGGAENLTFDILLHVATLFAVILYFRRDLLALVVGLFVDAKQRRLGLAIIVAMIPTGVIGLSIKRFIEQAFGSPLAVGAMLVVTGAVLFIAPRFARGHVPLSDIRLRHALVVGTAQGIAALPGISRSGMTICAGIAAGVQPEAAARFSFLLAIPAILAATTLDVRNIASFEAQALPNVAVGMGAAFLVGLFSIHWLLRVVRKGRLDGFAFYCWIVGGVTVAVSLWRAFAIQ